jgi:hypothetical protein
MSAVDSKSLSSLVLDTIKITGFHGLFDKLVSALKRREKVAKAPVDMEVDNLDWYRTFSIKK